MNTPCPIFCIMGPTASGKTALSLALAERFPIEIINVDSAQIYRGMDIGSGKLEKSILEAIPHHLMDLRDPKESYSVWHFCQDAFHCIEEIIKRGKIPLLVGGTMMYFHGLQNGLTDLPATPPEVRANMLARAEREGWEGLYQQLMAVDPATANRLAPADRQRISRALEVYEMTDRTLSDWQKAEKCRSPYTFINFALVPLDTPRSILHERIVSRFDGMLNQGLVEETRQLQQRGDLHENLPAIRAVGYRQVWRYLQNQYSFDEMREKAIIATRQLAKRQLTWLRNWSGCLYHDFADQNILSLASVYFKKISKSRWDKNFLF